MKLNRLATGQMANVYAKLENLNPGGSVKDRMAVHIIKRAEERGVLKPGSTIVESTSGNTGLGLAMIAAVKGYRLIVTIPDKMSQEKVDMLKGFGAEVIVTPTNVPHDSPEGYVGVAQRIAAETPNSLYTDQYNNLDNPEAHYLTTGPEIWDQTEGQIDVLVGGVGTGGTICGTGRYLKEKNPNIKILGIDTYGSVFKKYKETGIFDKEEIYPYITEGIGEDFLPANVDFSLIDHFEKVSDRDAAMMTRRIPREEGIFVGNSAGAALAGMVQMKHLFKAGDVVVVIFHDHGTRYLGKMYNDEWMRDRGFLEESSPKAIDMIECHKHQKLLTIEETAPVSEAIKLMRDYDISQLPVVSGSDFTGSLSDSHLYARLIDNPELRHEPVKTLMQKPFPFVAPQASLEEVSSLINRENDAVLVRDMLSEVHIITKYDIIEAIG